MTYVAIKLIFIGIAALGATLTAVSRAQHRAAIRRKMLAAPRTFEDNALVTLTGTAKLVGEPLIAPLSGRPCIAFRASARTYRLGSRQRTHRELDQEVTQVVMTSFVLVTADGDIEVNGETCELPMRSAPVIPRKLERERDFMIRAALIGTPQHSGFDEIVIQPGAKIMVHGIARKELAATGAETGFREAPTLIRITGDEAHPIAIDLV
jgi:hypothetical protein